MAEPLQPLDRAIQTGDGWIADIITNVQDLCKQFFLNNERMKKYSPRYYSASHPKSCYITEMPALHVYISKVAFNSPSAGTNSGEKLTTHITYFVNIQYLYHDPDSEDMAYDLYEIMSHLTDEIRHHHNLNGLVNTGKIYDVVFEDDFFATRDTVSLVRTGIIHAVFGRSIKDRLATR
jgi:hypothetical protein